MKLNSMDKEVVLNEVDRNFDPLPRSSTLETSISLKTATKNSPLELLIMDIRITKRVASIWTATDEYSLPNPGASEPTVSASSSLRDSPRLVGKPLMRAGSLPSGEPATRKYRGLWWGAERVWVGDLLRLSFSETKLNYAHANPDYFTDIVHTGPENCGAPPERLDPEEKYVFLKLKTLVPLTTSGGTEMYVIGDLYKLMQSPASAPIDQPEPEGNLGLPRPPEKFTFKPILSANIEAQFSLNLVKGRYYPRLPSSVDRQSVPEECGLKVMEGRGSTDFAAKRPIKYRSETRGTVVDAARSLVLG